MITISPISAFSDNYIWHLSANGEHWVVDPGDAKPVLQALGNRKLSGILITHHHWDHTGGIGDLVARYQCPVYGPASVAGVDHSLQDGDSCEVLGLPVSAIAVPGHTLDHLALLLRDGEQIHLFCGDTLFAAGCGRLFEGSPEQMFDSLGKLAGLPANTLVYCAHEYTGANLRFAAAVEPGNDAIRERAAEVDGLRAQDRPTLPSNIELELATNPFLRCHIPAVRKRAIARGADENAGNVEIFATLRQWKDDF